LIILYKTQMVDINKATAEWSEKALEVGLTLMDFGEQLPFYCDKMMYDVVANVEGEFKDNDDLLFELAASWPNREKEFTEKDFAEMKRRSSRGVFWETVMNACPVYCLIMVAINNKNQRILNALGKRYNTYRATKKQF
jgi:hypothetical protein